ncbi:MAG: hypothetical protein WC560_08110 [Syntrophales bacterium]
MNFKEIISDLSHYLKNREFRNKMPLFLVVICLYMLIIPAFIWERASRRELLSLNTKFEEFSILSREYKSVKQRVSVVEQKGSLTKTNSIAQPMDDIFLALGVKGKMKSIREIGGRELKRQMNEESAEIQMEKINMNELINILYRIDNVPIILSIKKVIIKKTFASPELLDVTLTVSLFTKPS